jgi:hypothetical protein
MTFEILIDRNRKTYLAEGDQAVTVVSGKLDLMRISKELRKKQKMKAHTKCGVDHWIQLFQVEGTFQITPKAKRFLMRAAGLVPDTEPIRPPQENLDPVGGPNPSGDIVTIGEICQAHNWDPPKARAILRKYTSKGPHGWAWSVSEVQKIENLISNEYPS